MKKYIKPNIDIENMVEEEMICGSEGVVSGCRLGNEYNADDASFSKRIINLADYNDDDMAWGDE